MHPVKGKPAANRNAFGRVWTRTLSRTRSVSSRIFWFRSRHGAPVRSASSPRVRQQRARRDSYELGLATVFRCAAAIRPADFCHLFHLTTCTHAPGSPLPEPLRLSSPRRSWRGCRFTTAISLRPDHPPIVAELFAPSGFFPSFDVDVAQSSDTPVARPILRAGARFSRAMPILRGVRTSRDRVLRTPVKGSGPETIRGAFFRSPARAIERCFAFPSCSSCRRNKPIT